MTPHDQEQAASPPASFPAAREALETIEDAVRTAQSTQPGHQPGPQTTSEQALAALLLLRQVRDQLAGWETGLVETAREAGASWAELAPPLGVASRQAAERRYLRLRPGAPGATGEQRVQATRERRAADRSVTAWARGNAADLRQLAGAIVALHEVPTEARRPLVRALGDQDVAALVGPLASTREHLSAAHPELAARVDALVRHTHDLRQADSDQHTAG